MPIRNGRGRFAPRQELVEEVERVAAFAEEALDEGDPAGALEYIAAGRVFRRLLQQRCPALRCDACGKPLLTHSVSRADECECDICHECEYPACVCDLIDDEGRIRLGAAVAAVAALRLTETPEHK